MVRKCYLCKSSERDEIRYGEFMTRYGVSVHYFCLLLTSNLLQRGSDKQGFLGFLLEDIKVEAVRVASAVCCYCNEKSANISCCATRCYKTFHLTCGLKNDAENQFVGSFKSFCSRHVSGKKCRRPQSNEICCICYEKVAGDVKAFNRVTMLQAPCCKNGWFHKWCLAAFAKSAGYFFKCPLCNDTQTFRYRLVRRGIYIPDRDAAWELEPNAYAELLERPNECSAKVCKARGGRATNNKRNTLIFCNICGSVAIHCLCMTTKNDSFSCDDCAPIVAAVHNSSIVNISSSQHTDSDEEEEVEICEDDGDFPILNNPDIEESEKNVTTVQPVGRVDINGLWNIDNEMSDNPDDDDGIFKASVHKRTNRLLSSDFSTETEDSDEDEGTIQPLGMVKRNGLRIFDDEMSDNALDDEADSIILNPTDQKRTKSLLSSDIESMLSVSLKRKRVTSRDSESLFDSGAESDRSLISGHKCNTSTTEGSSSTNAANEASNQIVNPENNNLHQIRKGIRRYNSLNDSENGCIAKRLRRQSMVAEIININSHKTEENRKYPLRRKSTFVISNCKTENIELLFSANSNKTVTQPKLEIRNNVKMCTRSETKSDDPSIASSASLRPRRRSFLQSPYGTPSQQDLPSKSNELLNSNRKLRSHSHSEVTENISHTNSTSDENKNDFCGPNRKWRRRSSRGRSPLSSNLCSLNAFITPTYVKKRNQQYYDSTSGTEVIIVPEVKVPFFKNKSNILQHKHAEVMKSSEKIESNNISTPSSTIKENKTTHATFLQSYSLLMHTPGKTKKHKQMNKRIPLNFSNQNLSINQTKIETFFKRV